MGSVVAQLPHISELMVCEVENNVCATILGWRKQLNPVLYTLDCQRAYY